MTPYRHTRTELFRGPRAASLYGESASYELGRSEPAPPWLVREPKPKRAPAPKRPPPAISNYTGPSTDEQKLARGRPVESVPESCGDLKLVLGPYRRVEQRCFWVDLKCVCGLHFTMRAAEWRTGYRRHCRECAARIRRAAKRAAESNGGT